MTAVKYLESELRKPYGDKFINEIFEQAKEMEKQQIIDANYDGQRLHAKSVTNLMLQDNAESYYNETYGIKGSDENFKQFSLYEHKETITSADTITSSQTEISDEEIYKEAEHKSKIFRGWTTYETSAFIMACQWYREQLKKK